MSSITNCAKFYEVVTKFLSMGSEQMQYEKPSESSLLPEYDFIIVGKKFEINFSE
jgi:hypothetical protein